MTSSSTITQPQLTQISQYYGYGSMNSFLSVFKAQDALIGKIQKEFKNISSVGIDSIKLAIYNVHYNLLNNKPRYQTAMLNVDPADLCLNIYNNCNAQASAVYSAACLACTGTAIGVGAATVVVGGFLFQIGCGGVAYYYLSVQRDACTLNYQQCIQKKN